MCEGGGRAVGAVGRSGRSSRYDPSGEHVCPFRPPDRLTARPPWHQPCSISHQIPRLIRRDTVVPYHTIAFSQQKLRAALRRSLGQEPAFNYGFVVHSRRHNEKPTLGLITLHGESLALSEQLLKGLDGLPIWLFGHARITFAARGHGRGGGAGQGQRRPPAADLAGHAHLHLRHQLRAHPAPGAGGGAGEGREPGAAADRADARAAGDLADVAHAVIPSEARDLLR